MKIDKIQRNNSPKSDKIQENNQKTMCKYCITDPTSSTSRPASSKGSHIIPQPSAICKNCQMIEHARESEAEVQTSARNKIEKIASYALTVNTPIKFLCYNVPCQRTVNCKNCKIQKKESINERKRHRKKFRWRFCFRPRACWLSDALGLLNG